jgi:hypothetical protein
VHHSPSIEWWWWFVDWAKHIGGSPPAIQTGMRDRKNGANVILIPTSWVELQSTLLEVGTDLAIDHRYCNCVQYLHLLNSRKRNTCLITFGNSCNK